jgi:hypothetical protein
MRPRDPRLVLDEEEAALDQGSVDQIAGKRDSGPPAIHEAIEELVTPEEEEAALDQGSVDRVAGTRPSLAVAPQNVDQEAQPPAAEARARPKRACGHD